ncbi:MAG: cytochrome c oxidase subunit II [Betaproteobacteria bacterium]|nr:cytochrome C oxidase subunit II [Betaproteobacteria bacterium]MDE2003550.1 cytochrome c oxidase subunit II [Betaproteobacteria bacterium]MDE2210417.1 cytochrome c oxidase subunit II [Betaproteobacteria bacterium]MDE2359419.1 cytochrome c oxidase subunit II [Betaproteobacteria bacterium]
MSAIEPPVQRLWWKQPLDRAELLWIVIALVWCLILFFMMPYWHLYGKQNLANEAYRESPDEYAKKTEAMVAKYKVREEGGDLKVPVVHPPAGGDAYLIARLWSWYPILELEAGKTYRLHLMSMDYLHGFSLQPENINIEVLPGYDHVITVTPTHPGAYGIVCNEYCGIGHSTMTNKLYVVK